MERDELISELRRLEKYGFYVIPEAIELAQQIDLAPLSSLPVSAAALAVSQQAVMNLSRGKPPGTPTDHAPLS